MTITQIEITFINKNILIFLEVLIFITPQMRVTKDTAVLNRSWPAKVIGRENRSMVDSGLDDKLERYGQKGLKEQKYSVNYTA